MNYIQQALAIVILAGSLCACQSIGVVGLSGNAIGRTPNSDDAAFSEAFFRATQIPIGESVFWRNGRTGNWGYHCPVRDGHTRACGDYCREFVSTMCIDGQVQKQYGVMCRRPDATWYRVSC